MFCTPHKIKNNLLLALFPLFYAAMSFAFLKTIHAFYILSPDPIYAYLFNGTNLAGGHLQVGHVDHPGTPIQCFSALVIFIKHFISGTGSLVYQSVLLHPESYLYCISVALTLVLALITFYTGTYILKHTASVATAILFQSAPLLSGIVFRAVIPCPESLLTSASVFFMAYLYIAVIKPEYETGKKAGYRQVLIVALFTGFLIACKFNAAILILLCALLFKPVKKKAVYILTTVASFFVLIIPALSQASYMRQWLIKLATRGGLYGSGGKVILNIADVKAGLSAMFFKTEITFPLVYAIIFVAACVALYKYAKNKTLYKVHTKALWAIWITITAMALIVTKHYKFYYLLPAQLCFPLGLIIAHKIFSVEGGLYMKYKKIVIVVLSLIVGISTISAAVQTLGAIHNQTTHVMQTQVFLKKYKNIPTIIVTSITQESAFVQPSIQFGIAYSGQKMKYRYDYFAKKYYPNTYGYIVPINKLLYWGENTAPAQVFCKRSTVLVYFRNTSTNEQDILNDFCTLNGGIKLGHYKKIYTDTVSHEDIYKAHADSALAAKLLKQHKEIFCDMETITVNKQAFVSADGHHYFQGAGFVSHTEHHSGNNSIEMNSHNMYALNTTIYVKPGYFIKASAWKKPVGNEGCIVLCSKAPGQFYSADASIADIEKNGWSKIEALCTIPADYKADSLYIYLYYPATAKTYFDDLKITIYPIF